MTQLLKALAQLDVANDAHWTADGAPRLETLKFFMSGTAVTRDQVTAEAPGFSRANAIVQVAQTGDSAAAGAGAGGSTPQPPIAAPAAQQPPATPTNGEQQTGAPDDREDGVGDGTSDPIAEAQPLAETAATFAPDPLEVAQRRLAVALRAKEEAEKEHTAAVQEVDALLDARTAAGKGETFQDQVGGYLRRQAELRATKAQTITEVKQMRAMGLNVAAETKSKLDHALGRRGQERGAARPQHPIRR